MPRATIILVIVLLVVVAGLVALSRKSAPVPLTTIEAPVTAGGDGAQK